MGWSTLFLQAKSSLPNGVYSPYCHSLRRAPRNSRKRSPPAFSHTSEWPSRKMISRCSRCSVKIRICLIEARFAQFSFNLIAFIDLFYQRPAGFQQPIGSYFNASSQFIIELLQNRFCPISHGNIAVNSILTVLHCGLIDIEINCVQFTIWPLSIAQAGILFLTLVFKGQTYDLL